MSKKPQKSSPASQRTSNGCGSGSGDTTTEQATRGDKQTQQHQPERATANTDKMTNENQEQPQHIQGPEAAAGAATTIPMPNLRPDRKRSRPATTAAPARDQQKPTVIKMSEPGGLEAPQAEATKSARVQVRQRLHPATCEPASQQVCAPASVSLQAGEQNICAACAKPIRERYLLMALDKRWHEDCLKCAGCDCRLGEVGSSLFTHADKLFCRRDFLRIFGRHGHCAACERPIPPYEMVMRANEHAYHMDCFACQQCQYRFCVGDRYHLNEAHKIICLVCHSEQVSNSRQEQSLAGDRSQLSHLQEQTSPTATGLAAKHQILSNISSPDHLSPPDSDLRLDEPPPQDSAEGGDTTSGSEPEVIESPVLVPETAGEPTTGEPCGQNFAELTSQRTTVSLKRTSLSDEGAASSATKRRPPNSSPHSLAAVTAPTTNGQEQACVM